MKHKIDYEIGKYYYIDEGVYGKQYKVKLIHFNKQTQMYATVRSDNSKESWQTMLVRLTEI